jgi:5-bromo-4-chloroindolyl phosphate hydrolysis protein
MKRGILIGILSASAFWVLMFRFRMPFHWALALALLIYLGLTLVLGRESSPADSLPEVEGMSKEEAYRVISEGRDKVAQMRRMRRKLPLHVATEVEAIAGIAGRIFDELEANPQTIRAARRFLEYYLDASLLVMTRYADLSRRGGENTNVREVMEHFEGLLQTIHATFEKQHDRLLRHDVLDLDTDITVLRRMMEMEGL